jgi:formylglycine-generating enzyme required for sulfatase activity
VVVNGDPKVGSKDPLTTFTNDLGMKFVWIAPGSFMMGSPMEEKGRLWTDLHQEC